MRIESLAPKEHTPFGMRFPPVPLKSLPIGGKEEAQEAGAEERNDRFFGEVFWAPCLQVTEGIPQGSLKAGPSIHRVERPFLYK